MNGSKSVDPLSIYLNDIGKVPLLTSEQESLLGERIAKGDSDAYEHMVRANLRLVVRIAHGFIGKGLDLQDLIEEGNLGLMRAAEDFDPRMGTKFSTYAKDWIKQNIKRALTNKTHTIRIPSYLIDLISKWNATERSMEKTLGRTPSEQEIADEIGITQEGLMLLKQAKSLRNLNSIKHIYPDRNNPHADIPDRDVLGPAKAYEHKIDIENILRLLGKLDERTQYIIRNRFGLDDGNKHTLEEIGKHFSITKERVRQIEVRTLRKLKGLMQK